MFRSLVTAAGLAVALPSAVQALDAGPLVEAMQIDQIVDVMRIEGLESGETMQQELLGGRGGERWADILAQIYDPARSQAEFAEALGKELDGQDALVARMLEFLATDPGRGIVTLEIEARRAMIDDAAEDAAKLRLEEMTADGDPRLDDLRRFAEVNELVEMNVAGALNTNLAFYRGMAEAGAMDGLSQEQMLADVWSQEGAIRGETEDWLYPYLALAYGPLTDADLRTYTEFSESEAGQRMNSAVFTAFDKVFARISYDIGEAAGIFLHGEDI